MPPTYAAVPVAGDVRGTLISDSGEPQSGQ